jgi:ABC-2 type transport system permease protein
VKALAIAGANVRRLLRDRTGLFFVFVFPIVIIITLGAVFGGGFVARLGVVSPGNGPLEAELVERLGQLEDVELVDQEDRAGLVEAVERGTVEAGLLIPEGYDDALRTRGGAELSFLARPGSFAALSLQSKLELAVSEQAALVRAARFAQSELGVPFDAVLEVARRIAAEITAVEVRSRVAGEPEEEIGGEGRFDFGAAQQLVLFMFLTALSAAGQLIVSRKLGVSRRMVSTPTSVRTVLLGEALGRFGTVMVQGLFIVVASALLFRVNWGDPLGTGLVVIFFALVGTGAAMLAGALLSNAEQAASVGVFAGLMLAALGGCMVPLEVFPDGMRAAAHVTPHAWAVEALTDLVTTNATLADVLPQVAVLAGFAAVLLALATWRLRAAIVGD